MKIYKLNGKLVARPQSLVIDGVTYVPPTDEELESVGYTIEEYEPQVSEATYEERVVQAIRLRYSVDDELAILRQRDTKPEEFEVYNAYCEACKAEAKL